jgi:outer membrane receptor protein involved in Fe transport
MSRPQNLPTSKRLFVWCELLLLVFLILLNSTLCWAGTGKIKGRVIDNKTKDPLSDVNVTVKGPSESGAATDLEGYYVILNLGPGLYTVTFSRVGYQTQIQEKVLVSTDLTTEVNASLVPTTESLPDAIIIFKPPEIQKDVSYKQNRIDAQQMQETVVQNFGDVLDMTAGVHRDQEGEFHFRGGRSHEVLPVIDGLSQRDALAGGTQSDLDFSTVNIEEVQVLTGGFSAQYGNAQSAIINVTTKEGDPDRYSGSVEWNTDRFIKDASFDTDIGRWTLGGPIPYSERIFGNKVTFFWSGSGNLTNTYTPYHIDRSPNDYLGLGFDMTERQSNDFQTRLKLAYRMDEKRKFTLSIGRRYRMWDVFPDGDASVSGNYGWQYYFVPEHRPYAINERSDWNLSFSHQVSSKTFYEVMVGYFNTKTTIMPRGKAPNQFTLRDSIEDESIYNIGYVDNNGDTFFDGYFDANSNGKYDGSGEGYEDLNRNGQWDRGEDWVDLNGNGNYDYAEPWTDRTDPVTGRNNVGVWDPWDPFTDLNGNGVWDPAEPQLPEQDWNHNGHWDGERFQDANYNGRYDGWGEGYDDMNKNGMIDHQDLFRSGTNTEDTPEPFVDGDFAWDTGEPFTDLPDSITGEYNGIWDSGEPWVDLPTSYSNPFVMPTLNNAYDGPNGIIDEYELFCRPANIEYGMDPRHPVIYTYDPLQNGRDWLYMGYDSQNIPLYRHYIPGKSTWVNRTLNDQANPVFEYPNGRWDQGAESFTDYNNNGVCDLKLDDFLNPGQWDASAIYQERESNEYTAKFDITSQLNRFHEFQAGLELKYRELTMQSIEHPDQLYNNPDVPLPVGSPYPDRGDLRDFYNHRPWEGSIYAQDKMEFEGLIVNAGLRWDFVFHDPWLIQQSEEQVATGQPGALLAKRGTYKLSPRLGISHPITQTSKLYFNYGHFYQAPDFQYFYRSATASITAASVVGNPNLEHEKTVQYELGVNTQVTRDWTVDIAGYYRDIYNLISTVPERYGPITIDRYYNLDYGRVRGVEITLEKNYSQYWSMSVNYDFSYAFGKASSETAGIVARLSNVPVNTDEYPLDWDETHKITAWATLQVPYAASAKDHPRWFGLRWPADWLATIQWEFGSGRPYTPSHYLTGTPSNLIATNSYRMPWTETTSIKVEKYFTWKDAQKKNDRLKLTLGVDVNNLFDKHNINAVYAETGNAYDSTSPNNPADRGPEGTLSDHNPRNYGPGRNIVFRIGLSF